MSDEEVPLAAEHPITDAPDDGLRPLSALPRALRRHAWLIGLASVLTLVGSVTFAVLLEPYRPTYEIKQRLEYYALLGVVLGAVLGALLALVWDALEPHVDRRTSESAGRAR